MTVISIAYLLLQVAMDIADAFKLPASKVVHVKVCSTWLVGHARMA
jgi:hypothetical protein